MSLDRRGVELLMDPALSTLWELHIPFAEESENVILLAERMQATSTKMPFRARFSAGSNTYFPDISDVDGINVSFYEFDDHRTRKWLNKWRKLIVTPEGNYGMPSVYKKEIRAKMYSKTDTVNPVMTFVYNGCAPTDVTAYELQYDDNTGRLTIEVQFSTDSVTEEENNG